MFFKPNIKEWGFSTKEEEEGEERGETSLESKDINANDSSMDGTLIAVEDGSFSTIHDNAIKDHQNERGNHPIEEEFFKPLDDAPSVKFALPMESIYSSAILVPFGASTEEYRSFGRGFVAMLVVFPHWVLVFFNMFAQGTFIFYISDKLLSSSSTGSGVCPSPFLLQISGLLVFGGVVYSDLLETLQMAMFIFLFPVATEHQPLSLKTKRQKDGNGVNTTENVSIVSGMRRWYKFVVYLLLLVPKLVIAGALLYFGSLFIMRSETNEDLILNTLSVTFIIEIDEILFRATSPSLIKCTLQQLPRLPHANTPLTNMLGGIQLLFGPYINVGVLAAYAILFQKYLCISS
eukprot:m.86981 g.86981  ORF g.86981 m.86981 type:complete len:348 (-) comp8779_c0_seq1:670-1713(-)